MKIAIHTKDTFVLEAENQAESVWLDGLVAAGFSTGRAFRAESTGYNNVSKHTWLKLSLSTSDPDSDAKTAKSIPATAETPANRDAVSVLLQRLRKQLLPGDTGEASLTTHGCTYTVKLTKGNIWQPLHIQPDTSAQTSES